MYVENAADATDIKYEVYYLKEKEDNIKIQELLKK